MIQILLMKLNVWMFDSNASLISRSLVALDWHILTCLSLDFGIPLDAFGIWKPFRLNSWNISLERKINSSAVHWNCQVLCYSLQKHNYYTLTALVSLTSPIFLLFGMHALSSTRPDLVLDALTYQNPWRVSLLTI